MSTPAPHLSSGTIFESALTEITHIHTRIHICAHVHINVYMYLYICIHISIPTPHRVAIHSHMHAVCASFCKIPPSPPTVSTYKSTHSNSGSHIRNAPYQRHHTYDLGANFPRFERARATCGNGIAAGTPRHTCGNGIAAGTPRHSKRHNTILP